MRQYKGIEIYTESELRKMKVKELEPLLVAIAYDTSLPVFNETIDAQWDLILRVKKEKIRWAKQRGYL